ncbi:unnamed protein product [Withania somnifera]
MVKSSCASLRVNQRLDLWKPMSRLLSGNPFVRILSTAGGSVLIDVRDNHLNSVLFSFGITGQCTRQEKILKYLRSGSNDVESGGQDMSSILFDLMGPLAQVIDIQQQKFASYLEQQSHDAMSQPSFVYPDAVLHLWEPSLNLIGLNSGKMIHSDGRMLVSGASASVEMKDILSIMSEFYYSKDTMKSTKHAMLVPYFDSPQKTKYQSSLQRKSNKKAVEEREIYRNNYLHACESLLSIIVDKKRHGKTAILSLKKLGLQVPHLLTKLSASIAGTGIAVLFSVACKLACGRIALDLWLSWAVNNLRDTVVVINRSPGKLDMIEEDMMTNLDKNVKQIYFRAATLLAVVVLRLA